MKITLVNPNGKPHSHYPNVALALIALRTIKNGLKLKVNPQ